MTAPTPLFDDGTTRLVALDLSDGSRLVLALDSKGITRAPGIAVLPAGSDLAPAEAGGGAAPALLKRKPATVADPIAAPAPEPAPAHVTTAAPSSTWTTPALVAALFVACALGSGLGVAVAFQILVAP